jgi:GNAT superfamily N-acetyltransferase
MKIIKATLLDIPLLDKITIASKSSWWYSQKEINSWKDDLKIHCEDIIENHTFIGKINNNVIWYVTYIEKIETNKIYLKNLFVHPDFLRNGYGSQLLDFITKQWKHKWFSEVYLESDPYAESFYQKNWYLTYNQKESSIPGRFLPLMNINL